MLSVKFEKFGAPDDVLRVEDVAIPEPGAGEVLVHMRMRAVNPSDLLMIEGLYGQRPQLPATPGYEGVGRVEKVGEGVKNFHIGQRVIPAGVLGAWQEYMLTKTGQLLPVPDSVNDTTAAQFVVNPLTAWVMVNEELAVKPGDWLLQTAASSTLGQVILQIARLQGFKTINVVRRREQAETLKALGADEVICTADEDLVARVMAITNNKGVSAAIDAVGGKVGSDVVRALGTNGTLLIYGLLSGESISLDVATMIFRTATVRGFWLSQWFIETSPEQREAVVIKMMTLMAKGDIVPPVEAEYELKDVLKAIKHAQTPGRKGKVLLVS